MGVAKVLINNVTQIDLTSDTVAANNLLSGYLATGADGERVTGAYSGIDTSDATAAASEIFAGKTAYVGGSKITGTAAVSVSGHTLIIPAGLISV